MTKLNLSLLWFEISSVCLHGKFLFGGDFQRFKVNEIDPGIGIAPFQL